MSNHSKRLLLVLALLPLLCSTVHAADIGRSLRAGDTSFDEEDTHFELGVSAVAADGLRFKGQREDDVRLAPTFDARYQWKRLFVEAFADTRGGWSVGYNAYGGEKLSIDLMVGQRNGSIDHRISDELDGIEKRDSDVSAGVRASGYVADFLWQVQAWGDVSDTHGGGGASALVGRSWQVRNWNLHALAGVGYSSANTLDYYFGITPAEAAVSNGDLSAYDADAGISYSAEVGVTYPLSQSWVMRTTARYGRLSGEIAESPLFESPKRDGAALIFNVSYVF